MDFRKLFETLTLRSQQHHDEIVPFCEWLMERGRPHTIVEIGTGLGGTCELLGHMATQRIISIDLPSGATSGMNESDCLRRNARLQEIHPHFLGILSDSQAPQVVEQVPHEIDLLFIDGDHSLTGVTRDYELYAPLVRGGGVIAFHDIQAWDYVSVGVDVPIFWRDLVHPRKQTFTIDGGEWGGIGVVTT